MSFRVSGDLPRVLPFPESPSDRILRHSDESERFHAVSALDIPTILDDLAENLIFLAS